MPFGQLRNVLVALGTACVLGLVLAGSASALTFSAPSFVPAGTQPHSVATGDFNGDGKADIATANIYSDTVSIHLGDGAGGFAPASFFGVGSNPEVVVSADFNGDGFADLATANITSDDVSILLGDGTGSFSLTANIPVGDAPQTILTADLNGDGIPDLVTTNVNSNDITVLLGDGSGGFSPSGNFGLGGGTTPTSVTAADFNNDGFQDLASSNFGSANLSVLFGDGTGSFGPATSVAITPATGPFWVASADLDGDGNQDLVSANYYTGSLTILLGDGAGGFTVQAHLGTGPGSNPDYVLVTDIDGDGNLDLVAAIYNQDSVVAFLGDGAGGFGPLNTYGVGANTYPVSIAVADFNGDGLPDLTTANFLPNFISVLLNTSPPPPKADVKITKTAAPTNARPGDVVTYTLKAKNVGNAVANDVVITDSLPVGLSFVSADAPCVEALGTVTCAIGSLAPNEEKAYEVKVKVDQWGTADPNADHLLDVQKVEIQLPDLFPGAKKIVQISCPSGHIVTDASVRVDHINQGGGDWPSIKVYGSRALSANTWRATVKSNATDLAQAKLFAVCVRQATVDGTHAHNLILSDPIEQSISVPAGTNAAVLECGPGQVAIQPGFNMGFDSELVYSQPEGNGWKFVFDSPVPDDIDISIACMTRQVSFSSGHTHDLNLKRISHEVEIGPGQVNEAQLTCADGSKGLVAGWDLDHGLVSLGNDPRPVTRPFKVYNPTNAPLKARLSLLCLGEPTAGEHLAPQNYINTAYISTSSAESVTSNTMSSATVTGEDTDNYTPVPNPLTVKPTPNNPVATTRLRGLFLKKNGISTKVTCSAACSGTAKLFSLKKSKKAKLLAAGHYKLNAAGTKTLRLKFKGKKAKRILKKTRKGQVKLSNGTKRKVRIKRRTR